MYGTVAKLRVKPGSEPLLEAWMASFADNLRRDTIDGPAVLGFISSTIYRSDEDPQVYWMAVLFESREAYRANAESPNMDARYRRFRSCLEADPEWHDGEVSKHITLS